MPEIDHEWLRDLRDEQDISNEVIAERSSISHGYVRNILCGFQAPSQRVIYRLERAVGLPKGALTAGKRTPDGDPSEPPKQPKGPKRPPKKDDTKGPKRADDRQAVAS